MFRTLGQMQYNNGIYWTRHTGIQMTREYDRDLSPRRLTFCIPFPFQCGESLQKFNLGLGARLRNFYAYNFTTVIKQLN